MLLRRSIGRRCAGRIAGASASGGCGGGRRGMGGSEAEGNATVRRVFAGPPALLLGEGAGLHRRGGAVICGGGGEGLRRGRRLMLLRRRNGAKGESRGGGGQHGGGGGGGEIRAEVGGTVGCRAHHHGGRRWAGRLAYVHCVGSRGE